MDDSFTLSAIPLRPPNPSYHGKNGFDVGFVEQVDSTDKYALNLALDRDRVAQRILETKGRPIPRYIPYSPVYGMLTDGHLTVRESIKELQDEHLEDLKILYDYHAAEYIQDMKDFYVSRDDTVYLEEGERDQQIIAGYQRSSRYQQSLVTGSSLIDEFTELRHTYLARLLELQQRLQDLEKREAAAMRVQASKFPQSVFELNDSPKEVQQRVAKFLLSGKQGQEKMLDEFGWAWRQTEALMNEYKTNLIFAASMRSLDPNAQQRIPETPKFGSRQGHLGGDLGEGLRRIWDLQADLSDGTNVPYGVGARSYISSTFLVPHRSPAPEHPTHPIPPSSRRKRREPLSTDSDPNGRPYLVENLMLVPGGRYLLCTVQMGDSEGHDIAIWDLGYNSKQYLDPYPVKLIEDRELDSATPSQGGSKLVLATRPRFAKAPVLSKLISPDLSSRSLGHLLMDVDDFYWHVVRLTDNDILVWREPFFIFWDWKSGVGGRWEVSKGLNDNCKPYASKTSIVACATETAASGLGLPSGSIAALPDQPTVDQLPMSVIWPKFILPLEHNSQVVWMAATPEWQHKSSAELNHHICISVQRHGTQMRLYSVKTTGRYRS
ncbi:hypothetical protein FA13DRAFT_1807125 [Coprinellus micaceus]|uniref:Uncharacterized protein n=1 Tax=Coprinellus micaceus TaxID=71717 RepID=A0A4Y7RBN5_COPMI|nr:hypothetical protein FA13DRAFT_1807125 [Coprinellus micaceus]